MTFRNTDTQPRGATGVRLCSRLLGAVASGVVTLWGCSSPGPPSVAPKIVFQETTHDFGRTAQGNTVTQTYAFYNAGGLDLTIDNVHASCGCTVAIPSGRVVRPGGEGTIDVRLDTTRDVGRKTRTITVYSNDPAQPVTTLNLVGDIDAEVAADPPALYVGHVQRGQAARNEVRLLTGDAVVLSTAETRSKVIDASLQTVAGATRLHVSIKPDAPAGRFKDTVTVRTKSAQQRTVTIPIAGVVDADDPSGHRAEQRG